MDKLETYIKQRLLDEHNEINELKQEIEEYKEIVSNICTRKEKEGKFKPCAACKRYIRVQTVNNGHLYCIKCRCMIFCGRTKACTPLTCVYCARFHCDQNVEYKCVICEKPCCSFVGGFDIHYCGLVCFDNANGRNKRQKK